MTKIADIKRNTKSGAYEWAGKTVNCCTGCGNNCRYCYARHMAVRFGRSTDDQWSDMVVREHDVIKKHRNYGELIMFPSSHDITRDNLDACRTVLKNLLKAGNHVLVVSKPDPVCIRALCEDCLEYSDKVLFRFTIGAMDNALLKLWEPGAPSFGDRLWSLRFAFELGFATSVSVEPMIDADNVVEMVGELLPYVTDTLWIGKMNYLGRVRIDSPEVAEAVARVRTTQADERILEIYSRLKNIPQIRWKDSVQKIVQRQEVMSPR